MSEHTELRMRVGRETGHTLYLQRGDEASSLDDFLGSVTTRELAMKIAEAWNEYWPEPDPSTLGLPNHVDQVKRAALELDRQNLDG